MSFKAGVKEARTWHEVQDDSISSRVDVGFGAEFGEQVQVVGTNLFELGFRLS